MNKYGLIFIFLGLLFIAASIFVFSHKDEPQQVYLNKSDCSFQRKGLGFIVPSDNWYGDVTVKPGERYEIFCLPKRMLRAGK
jgi:hypothetical protein